MNRISQLRQAMGISMKEAARRLRLPYTTYVGYEKGTREPAADTLLSLADFFGVSLEYLLGRDAQSIGLLPMPKLQQLPLLGTIACGEPILAGENLDGTVAAPAYIDFHKYVFHAASGASFALASLGNDAGAYGAFKLALDAFG